MTADTEKTLIEVVRLRVRPQFIFVRGGRAERRKSLVVQARKRSGKRTGQGIGEAAAPHAGAGFTATKKIGNAVIRNRAKRRLREAARQLLPRLGQPGWDYVFIARQDTADIGWPRLLDDMESALISLAAD
ncbi:ribonuclease P protein component [Hyphomonas adhaerens MHS-3]|uniref:Ribonuclease P protein component n=1 Tax=Hyphomonas adhaerens MHS-3 TaxID=1280949 RepID=A0A069E4W7_9PROT|nr:ribonuclease P protein component [Hyphomonas adhaerens]KCZ85014.1 ribonuclease P protein component [Hyphomonas adhaerens MHS-3]